MRLVTFFSLMFLANVGFANCEYKYDWETGNNYRICSEHDGSTTVHGNNYGTGSSWEINQKQDGTYSGRDADYNRFEGDNNTGRYINYGTGKYCTGTGYSRVCTGE